MRLGNLGISAVGTRDSAAALHDPSFHSEQYAQGTYARQLYQPDATALGQPGNDDDLKGEQKTGCSANFHAAFWKRASDIVLSIGLLVATAPLLVMTAIAIKLDSPGPVFYRQTRIGLNGLRFSIWKFRSMVKNAEANGAQYAKTNDARLTRVGRFIRKVRIDEIPQAINVLRGEMSFVGPRPERPEFVDVLEEEIVDYHARHGVKPGITGWAQVQYEYADSVEGAREKLRYDLYYVNNRSIWLDLAIVLMTIRVALFGVGSR